MVLSKIIVALLLGSFQDINLNSPTEVFLNSPADILIRSCIRLVEFSNRKRGRNSNSPMGVFLNAVGNGNRVRATCACGARTLAALAA